MTVDNPDVMCEDYSNPTLYDKEHSLNEREWQKAIYEGRVEVVPSAILMNTREGLFQVESDRSGLALTNPDE